MPRSKGSSLATGATRIQAENLRCSEIEGERERREISAAMAEVRQRAIERRERELRLIESLPVDYPGRADWYMDWRKELLKLLSEGSPHV